MNKRTQKLIIRILDSVEYKQHILSLHCAKGKQHNRNMAYYIAQCRGLNQLSLYVHVQQSTHLNKHVSNAVKCQDICMAMNSIILKRVPIFQKKKKNNYKNISPPYYQYEQFPLQHSNPLIMKPSDKPTSQVKEVQSSHRSTIVQLHVQSYIYTLNSTTCTTKHHWALL